jgi:hypothetical protein
MSGDERTLLKADDVLYSLDTTVRKVMGKYEDYLQGKPLTEEIAEYGDPRPVERSLPTNELIGFTAGITDDDRIWLKRLTHEPGWLIYLNLIERSIQRRTRMATQLSSIDPLGNKEKIADAWAYVSVMRAVSSDTISELENEILQLEKQDL